MLLFNNPCSYLVDVPDSGAKCSTCMLRKGLLAILTKSIAIAIAILGGKSIAILIAILFFRSQYIAFPKTVTGAFLHDSAASLWPIMSVDVMRRRFYGHT